MICISWRISVNICLINSSEITAANKADVCTYAITQGADVDQPVGFHVVLDYFLCVDKL